MGVWVLHPTSVEVAIVFLIVVQFIHLMFSIYSYFFLRNKQFSPCKKGEYRGG